MTAESTNGRNRWASLVPLIALIVTLLTLVFHAGALHFQVCQQGLALDELDPQVRGLAGWRERSDERWETVRRDLEEIKRDVRQIRDGSHRGP